MSQVGIQRLLDRVESDESFREVLLVGSLEDRGRLLREEGYDVEPRDIAALRGVAGLRELPDDELVYVAEGGAGTTCGNGFAMATFGLGLVVVCAAVAAAA